MTPEYAPSEFYGELSESHGIVRDAGRQEERQRVLVEIVLALEQFKDNSWQRDALLALRERVVEPRPKEELDALLLASIKRVAL